MKRPNLVAFIVFVLLINVVKCELITDETLGERYLKDVNEKLRVNLVTLTESSWEFATNITDATTNRSLVVSEEFSNFQKSQLQETLKYNWSNYKEFNKRQFEKLAVIGTAALNDADGDMFRKISTEMESDYSSAKVCIAGKCGLELDPDLSKIMATSTNYTELTEVWTKWRDAAGKVIRNKFITYYTLGNKAASLNKVLNRSLKTLDDLWLYAWESDDIKQQTAELWEKIKPFYQKLHAYVRSKLRKAYPNKLPNDNTIPAHILGNMWAQSWSNTMNTIPGIDPYPDVETIDVTQALKQQNYTAVRMFKLSDDFFGGLGLARMTDTFWKKSVIVKPTDGTVMVCHASAWDFYSKEDFRIKQCTNINMEDLVTIHHEMGHIEYYMQYADQPTVYREGANPGFHEAIGDLLALSVSTPKHLKKIGLVGDIPTKDMEKINLKYQLRMALDKLAFLPFGYLMDKYRWDVFSGEVSSKDLNRHWWKLRMQLQGVSPPVNRSELDFDPGAKYHIPAGVEYIRYFVSHILQFQFHKALCDIAQPNVPLYECDIDGNLNAGSKLKEILKIGASLKWPQTLKIITGSEKISVEPLIEYFKPLNAFLDKQLVNETIGWNVTDKDVDRYMAKVSGLSVGSGSAANYAFTAVMVPLIAIFICVNAFY